MSNTKHSSKSSPGDDPPPFSEIFGSNQSFHSKTAPRSSVSYFPSQLLSRVEAPPLPLSNLNGGSDKDEEIHKEDGDQHGGDHRNKNKDLEEEQLEKLEKRKDKLQYVEYGVNAVDYADTAINLAQQVRTGAHAVEDGANIAQDMLTDAELDQAAEALNNIPHQVADTTQGADAINNAAEFCRGEATEQIVDGHKWHLCIDDTCLEEPVRFVAKQCAVPCYECLGKWCFSCACSGSGSENIQRAGAAGAETGDLAGDAEEGCRCARSVFEVLCGVFDQGFCVLDEALGFILPVIGLFFSLYRLLQGTKLTCRGFLGGFTRNSLKRKTSAMEVAEGQARLWQGCCGLIGGAPGLIIITFPVILACSLVARKVRKKRLALERGELNEQHATAGATEVVTAQPLPDDDRNYYAEAYKAVSGGLEIEKVPAEMMESGLVPGAYEYPNAPRNQWSSGVFDCFTHVPSCMMACCCQCIITGQVAEAARLFPYAYFVIIFTFFIFYLLGISYAATIVMAVAIAIARMRVAKIYNIRVNFFGNLCLSFCCSCCAVAQVARHLFAWGKAGACTDCCECSRRPVSKWLLDEPTRRPSSCSNDYGDNCREIQVITNIQAAHAPNAVAPMDR